MLWYGCVDGESVMVVVVAVEGKGVVILVEIYSNLLSSSEPAYCI